MTQKRRLHEHEHKEFRQELAQITSYLGITRKAILFQLNDVTLPVFDVVHWPFRISSFFICIFKW
jgi:hypothetical protein